MIEDRSEEVAEDRGVSGPGGADAGPDGTGDARVDEAVTPLRGLADVPLEDHPAIFERIHDRLREVLGQLNPGAARPAGPPGPAGSPGPPDPSGPPGTPGNTGAP